MSETTRNYKPPTIAEEGVNMNVEVLNQEQENEIPMFEEVDEVEETEDTEETEIKDEPEAETKETETTPSEEFELKYNGEILKKSREELITLAQKGMNYDKVAQERDTLRNSPEGQLLDKIARQQGISRTQLLQAIEQNLEAQETQAIVNDLRNKYPDASEELLNQTAQGILSQRKADTANQETQRKEEAQKDRQRQDIETFVTMFPNVDIKENFTKEMLQEASQKGLVAVWQEKLLKDKEAEIEQLKSSNARAEQETKNKNQSLGSVTGNGVDESDALLAELLN